MEAIKSKIQELLRVSNENLMTDEIIKSGKFGEKFDAKMNKQDDLMEELETLARAQKTLLGRTQRFPMADSYALYLITKVNKKTVELTWLNWCDAWVDDRLGYKGTISREYVQKQKNFDDWWADEAEAKRLANIKGAEIAKKESSKEFKVTAEE